jgi:hypothetical protein
MNSCREEEEEEKENKRDGKRENYKSAYIPYKYQI